MELVRAILLLLLIAAPLPCAAQQVIPLWGDDTPAFARPHEVEEYEAPCWEVMCAWDVVNPTLTIYKPEGESNENMVLILPGGGYTNLAVYHEGYEIAEYLAAHGTTAAVLKYRIPHPDTSTRPELAPLSDVHRALKLLRENQEEYGISASQFGVMGFSAGSHLATFASVHRAADAAMNPDFSMLIYGVTRLTPENRKWLEDSLYYRSMSDAEVAEQTLLERVDERTPPAFLVHALDDETCHYTESTLYAEALTRRGQAAEIHLFPRGGHGFGPGRKADGTDQWLPLAANWLDRLGDTTPGN